MSSDYLGDDPYGNPVYDTVRSPLGEQLFQLKYRQDKTAVRPIVEVAVRFLNSWKPDVQLLLPTPPSNEDRRVQPVHMIAEAMATEAGIEFCDTCLSKTGSTAELKNVHVYSERVKVLRGIFSVIEERDEGRGVLVLDDLFPSGATLSALTESLYNCRVRDVFVMTITKTRVRS